MNATAIFKNYPLGTESYEKEDIIHLVGGENQDIIDEPNGGFPPIYICTKKEETSSEETEQEQKREYKTHKQSISIKTLLAKRRKVPFST